MHISPRKLLLPLTLAIIVTALASGPDGAAESGGSERKRPDGATSSRATPSTAGERAARIALQVVGVPYHYGGQTPASGFDCSGLVRWAYGRLGVDLPHSSHALSREGRHVSSDAMQPGDVLLFEGLGHVGLYLGRGRMVHAPQSGREVEVVALRQAGYDGRLVGARRIVRA